MSNILQLSLIFNMHSSYNTSAWFSFKQGILGSETAMFLLWQNHTKVNNLIYFTEFLFCRTSFTNTCHLWSLLTGRYHTQVSGDWLPCWGSINEKGTCKFCIQMYTTEKINLWKALDLLCHIQFSMPTLTLFPNNIRCQERSCLCLQKNSGNFVPDFTKYSSPMICRIKYQQPAICMQITQQDSQGWLCETE